MVQHIGIDLGTSTIKVVCGSNRYLIPSIVGEVNPGWSGMTIDKSLENNLVLIEGNQEYYVGELARIQSEVKRAIASEGQMKSAEDTFIAIKAALGLLVDKDYDEVVIATGVPVATSLGVMKNLSRMLKGELDIKLRNDATGEERSIKIRIQKTLVLPEPYGTYYGTLKERGEETAVDTVIIDIGHGSTDILTMYQGRPMRTASGSLVEATDVLTSRMAKSLQEKTGTIIKPFNLMMTLKKGKETVMISGRTYSIKEIKEYYAKQISKIII
ncbi:MAG: hypothetical protein ACTSPY_17030, partial [Candidatus Helarchaeota archaeon]